MSSDPPVALRSVHDHCTLNEASSTVRFQSTGTTARVWPMTSAQFIIEDDTDNDGTHRITAKKVPDTSSGLQGLRAAYTLFSVFLTGFIFIFCVDTLLFVILDLTIELGLTGSSSETHGVTAAGILMSLPLFIWGFASALVLAQAYVIDTWQGHPLVKRFVFGELGGVLTEWVSLIVFVGVPAVAIGVTSIMSIKNWWEIASFVWFCSLAFFYVLFSCCVVWYENKAAWAVIKNRYHDDDDRLVEVLHRCFLMRQRSLYSGEETSTYFARGAFDAGRDSDHKKAEEAHTLVRSTYAKIASMKFFSTDGGIGLFEDLGEGKKRQYTIDEALDIRPYLTNDTWSLERIFCRPAGSRYITLLHGPASLTREQMWSSLYCAALARFLILFVLAGCLVWLGAGFIGTTIVLLFVLIFGMRQSFQHSYRMYNMVKALLWVKDHEDEDVQFVPNERGLGEMEGEPSESTPLNRESLRRSVEAESSGIYEINETFRTHEATDRMCYVMFAIEFVFLFLWPCLSLLSVGSTSFVTIFIVVVVFSAIRAYVNSAIVLEEVGNFDLVDGDKDSREFWFNQSRLATITNDVSRSRARPFWIGVLSFFLFCFLTLLIAATSQQGDTTSDFQLTYMPDHYYEQAEDLQYPTCSIGKGLSSLGGKKTDISDFVFIAALAYRDPSITQGELDQWFGEGVAVDNEEYVQSYREENNVQSAVSFKLITFPNVDNQALLAIRGTTNAWDALSDAQLWSSAMIFQAVRFLLPMAEIWTPMMHRLTSFISGIASKTINKVAFYRETTKFAKHLLAQKEAGVYGNVQVTGHSLGGGLSMITGAQAGIPAVAVSGPNAMISRDTFDPPVSIEALNTKTFNIIPDRDIVPRLDDTAALFQKVRCTTAPSDFVGCHDGRRTLCEILYTCGTGNRPALCDCTCEFGYPEPLPKDGADMTFEDMCKNVKTCVDSGYFK